MAGATNTIADGSQRGGRVPAAGGESGRTEGEATRPAGGGRRPNQRDVQKAETRRRLLNAATEVFIEQGPITASLEEIASRAGVSRPTLIFHFGTRLDLMDAVCGYHLENIREWGHDYRPGELRPFLEVFLESQKDPVVRLVWTLGSVVHPDGLAHSQPSIPNQSYWDRFVVLEERIAKSAGVSEHEARKRAVLLAPALLAVARRQAQDLVDQVEVEEFLETACEFALAAPSP